ncbi:MAG: helix-turn-helix transcriptional regulator [Candidatus Bathyarchaeota archaeon]|nr:MAG: helix-turn-helix transcriptional regulator [Candidatus Bathyarchaeota archaeon]
MARDLREGVEDAVLQALGHRERRNILEVVASSGDGVLYSDILHELGMNTGKLNYHLKLLEGVIEKDDSRRYRLTDLGSRAVRLLRGLTEDLDEESVRRFSSVRGTGDEFVQGVVGWYFNLVIALLFTAMMGAVVFVAIMMRRDLDLALGYGVIGSMVVGFVLASRWLLKVKREAPEMVVGFLQRLGLYRNRG